MACYWPTPARQDEPGGTVKLNPPLGSANLAVPCGTCIGCRQDRATQWAHRSTHEASLWPATTFLTLTYDDEHLPPHGYLDAAALTRFIKRFRQYVNRHRRDFTTDSTRSPRYLACGEYGETTGRPHYHLVIYNCGITDGHRVGGAPGAELFESPILNDLWRAGGHRYAHADPGAAGNYVAQYILKKQLRKGIRQLPSGDWIDRDGALHPRPPFLRMSLKPAIGNDWLKKHATDLRHGYLVTKKGTKAAIPRTYLKKLKTENKEVLEEIEYNKEKNRIHNPTDARSVARLRDAELIHTQKTRTRH